MIKRFLFTAFYFWLTAFAINSTGVVATVAQEKPKPIAFEEIIEAKNAGDAQISPDGKWIAYRLSYVSLKDNEQHSEIWMVSTTGGEPRRFTSGKMDSSPRWSPDGKWLAFISARPTTGGAGSSPPPPTALPQIYLIRFEGGEAEKLTDSKTGISAFSGTSSFSWSPDSKQIVYVAQNPPTEIEEKRQREKDDAQVIDADYRFSQLWVANVETKVATNAVKRDIAISDPKFSPDGKQLSYTAAATPAFDETFFNTDLYIANADGSGVPRKIHENNGLDVEARWSPDGNWIAFRSSEPKNNFLRNAGIYIVSTKGADNPATPRLLVSSVDYRPSNLVWSADGKNLFFQSIKKTSMHVFAVPTVGGEVRQISADEAVIESFSLSNDNRRIAFTRTDLDHPAEVYAAAPIPNFKATQLTNHNSQLAKTSVGRHEIVRWKSKDGTEVEGIVIYPLNYVAGQQYPLIVNVHGGPTAAWLNNFAGNWYNGAHVWSGKGWVVFLPNVRGSIGYGEKFLSASVRDWGGGDFEDIQTGVDKLIERGVVAPNKLGITGWSYGGYLAAWTITQTNRYKAAVVGAGLNNLFSMYSGTDTQQLLEGFFGSQPWDEPSIYSRSSPMTFIKKAKTPTLVMHGANDNRVPPTQSRELYMGLRKSNVPAQLVIFPRETHGLAEPRHQLDKLKREYEWLAKYVLADAEK